METLYFIIKNSFYMEIQNTLCYVKLSNNITNSIIITIFNQTFLKKSQTRQYVVTSDKIRVTRLRADI